jgi:hypothetical protein
MEHAAERGIPSVAAIAPSLKSTLSDITVTPGMTTAIGRIVGFYMAEWGYESFAKRRLPPGTPIFGAVATVFRKKPVVPVLTEDENQIASLRLAEEALHRTAAIYARTLAGDSLNPAAHRALLTAVNLLQIVSSNQD